MGTGIPPSPPTPLPEGEGRRCAGADSPSPLGEGLGVRGAPRNDSELSWFDTR